MSDQNTVKIRTYLRQIAVLTRFVVSNFTPPLCLCPSSSQHHLQMAKGPHPVVGPHGKAVSWEITQRLRSFLTPTASPHHLPDLCRVASVPGSRLELI